MIVLCNHCKDGNYEGSTNLRIDSINTDMETRQVTIKLHCKDCLEHTELVVEQLDVGEKVTVELEFTHG